MSAICFPVFRYLFLVVIFVISIILIFTSKHMELMGWTVLLLGDLLLSGSLGMDILDYSAKGATDMTRQYSAASVFISLIFTLVSLFFIVISLYSVNNKFSMVGIPLNLEGDYRTDINQARDYFVAVFVLIFAVSLNVYFSPKQITDNTLAIINYFTDIKRSPFLNGLYYVLGTIMVSLWITLCVIFNKEDNNGVSMSNSTDKSLQLFFRDFYILSGMGQGLIMVEVISQIIWLYGKEQLNVFSPAAASISTGLLSFGMSIVAFVFAAFLLDDYINLDNPNAYNSLNFNDVFKSFISITIIFFGLNIANSQYFKEFFLVLFRYLAPLAILVISSYLVFLGNKTMKLHTHYAVA